MDPAKTQIRTFLSHKYESPAVNLYFWDILSEEAGFQFQVDEGNKKTSVTRLEMLMRESDAIVGIFTLPNTATTPDDLIKESAYLRLETHLAIRSGKPTLLYVDDRYDAIFSPLQQSLHVRFF